MALEAVAAGHPHELEAVAGGLVGLGQPLAQGRDGGHRQLEELGQQLRLDRLGRHHHDRLDGPDRLGGAGIVGRCLHRAHPS
jgi:hypothetical protein